MKPIPCAAARPELLPREELLKQRIAAHVRALFERYGFDEQVAKIASYAAQRYLTQSLPGIRFAEPNPDVVVEFDRSAAPLAAGELRCSFVPKTPLGEQFVRSLQEQSYDIQPAR